MCTTLTFKTNDGSMIHGRTDEFGLYYRNDLVLFPRNYQFSNNILGETTKMITSKYAMFGTNIGTLFGDALSSLELINDAMNEAGLSMSMLYYPGYAKYKMVKEVAADEIDIALVARNVLATCSNVAEAVEAIEALQGKIVAQIDQPAHMFFADKEGNTLVVEPDQAGYLTIYRENNGVMTNAPTYAFHLMNLNQYVNVQQIDGNVESALKGVDGKSIFAHGTAGAFGIPGDTSPASRFIKASYLRDTTTRKDLNTADDGVLRMLRILNNFDIVPGMSLKRADAGKGEGGVGENANPVDFDNVTAGHTDHTEVKDLTNGRYFYTTQNNQAPRFVQFSDYDLDAKTAVKISMENDESAKYQRVTLK